MKVSFYVLFIAFSCLPFLCFGQEISRDVIASQGSYYASGNNASLEWTLGEITVNPTDPCFYTNGFHQSFLAKDCGFNEPEEVPLDEDLHIYPVPAKFDLFIELDKGLLQFVTIYDNAGALIQNYTFESAPYAQLDLRYLSAGLYVIHIITDRKTLNRKILKVD